jgi:hypothetical protein
LQDISSKYKRLSVVGMAKNAGKTTTLNHLIGEAEEANLRLGVTSTGRDGEIEDVVTGTDKPKVYLPEGTIVATPSSLYEMSEAGLEIMRMTDFSTPLGRIMLCRVVSAGYVQVAGPATTAGQRSICEEMSGLGAELILIDGAIDRKSIAAPDSSDAIILATGAVISRSLVKVAEETAYAAEIFGLPVLEDGEIRSAIRDRSDRILIISEEGVRVPDIKTGLAAGRYINEALFKASAYVYIPGALTKSLVAGIEPARLGEIAFVVSDPTKLFMDRISYKQFKAKGLMVFVLAGINIAAITVNPRSPEGYSFDSGELTAAIRTVAGGIPVFDVRVG